MPSMKQVKQIAYRSWYYFRTGQGTYIGYLIAYLNFVGVFWLIVRGKDLGLFSFLTQSLIIFTIIVAFALAPFSVLIGYAHMKRSGAFAADAVIGAESNPLTYRILPGKEQEAWAPAFLLTLQSLRRLAEKEGILSPEEREAMLGTEEKLKTLISGKPISGRRRIE